MAVQTTQRSEAKVQVATSSQLVASPVAQTQTELSAATMAGRKRLGRGYTMAHQTKVRLLSHRKSEPVHLISS